jgi:hypothetical protein
LASILANISNFSFRLSAGYSNVVNIMETLKFMMDHPEIEKGDTIEVEIDPNPEFIFHSVFVCPITKVCYVFLQVLT